jgi:transposase-like protein
MVNTLQLPKTLQEAIAFFSDPQKTFDYAVKLRWPDGKVTCPRCNSTEQSFISTRRIWFCKDCKKQFTVKVGTIFEDSALGMDKWMIAVWMLANSKNGISSYELARALGITQKSAWFMLQRIRLAMQKKDTVKLGGNGREVEVDETYIGGAGRFMHKERKKKFKGGRGWVGKAAVMGLLERHGEVRTSVLSDTHFSTLQGRVRETVAPGSQVFTDAATAYIGIDEQYIHHVIDHAEAYAKGNVHTNGLENFWSLLKRGLKGTYVSVEPFHLFRYVDEQAFRYNNRATKKCFIGDRDRFQMIMNHIANRRVTYQDLTGKGTDTVHHV